MQRASHHYRLSGPLLGVVAATAATALVACGDAEQDSSEQAAAAPGNVVAAISELDRDDKGLIIDPRLEGIQAPATAVDTAQLRELSQFFNAHNTNSENWVSVDRTTFGESDPVSLAYTAMISEKAALGADFLEQIQDLPANSQYGLLLRSLLQANWEPGARDLAQYRAEELKEETDVCGSYYLRYLTVAAGGDAASCEDIDAAQLDGADAQELWGAYLLGEGKDEGLGEQIVQGVCEEVGDNPTITSADALLLGEPYSRGITISEDCLSGIQDILSQRLSEDGLGRPALRLSGTVDTTYAALRLVPELGETETLVDTFTGIAGDTAESALTRAQAAWSLATLDALPAELSEQLAGETLMGEDEWENVDTAYLLSAAGITVEPRVITIFPITDGDTRARAFRILSRLSAVENKEEVTEAWSNSLDDFLSTIEDYSGPSLVVTDALRAAHSAGSTDASRIEEIGTSLLGGEEPYCSNPAQAADEVQHGVVPSGTCSVHAMAEERLAGVLGW